MPITFTCPNPECRAKMTVPDSVAGKRGKCSKCKGPLTVPAQPLPRPAAPSKATPIPAPRTTPAPRMPAKPPAPRIAEVPPPPPMRGTNGHAPPPEEPAIDADSAAAEVFSDAPTAEDKAAEFIEFNCPQCDDPIKMPLAMGGKRDQCPSCRRIILVPIPKRTSKTSWRDTGPNLPAGARRDDEPPPDGAWNGKATAVGHETLKEAGVIQAKRKPLTLLQTAWPYLLLGTPVVMLAIGGLFLWQYLNRVSEKRALDTALTSASSVAGQKALGTDGLIAVHGMAGRYYLRKSASGSIVPAGEQYRKVVAVASATHSAAADALLGELAVDELDLGGTKEEARAESKFRWADTQKIVASTLGAISDQPARLAALRRIVAGLAAHGQVDRVVPMTLQLYPTKGADRCEAMATVGLELLRLGKKEEANKIAIEAEAPFAGKTDTQDRPALRAAVVALAVVLDHKPPESNGSIDEDDQFHSGRADGLARLGKMEDARKAIAETAEKGEGRLRARVALIDGAYATKKGDPADLEAALAAVGTRRSALTWVYLRLVELALEADIDPARLEPAINAIADASLADWARLQVYRRHLHKTSAIEEESGLGNLTTKSLAGLVGRCELARHNTRLDRGWGKLVQGWDEGARAAGSMGVALGMQGGK